MKRKIAVLTTHRANNYGAVLQSYALTHKINQLGGNCEILDYRCPVYERLYHSCYPVYRGHNPLISIRNCISRTLRRYWRDCATITAFTNFRKERLVLSRSVYVNAAQLAEAEFCYDIFLVGSDQVWNPACTTGEVKTFDRTYFLDFVRDGRKKNSYAASIGVSIVGGDLAEVYRHYLRDFATLTMREHKGAEIIQSILEREVYAVCDPVLLLEASEWQQVEQSMNIPEKDYILVYNVAGGKGLENYAAELASANNCAVYHIQPPVVRPVASKKRYILTGVGPAEFVWLVRNARIVVTNSFHCSAFSLLFGKHLHVRLDNSHNVQQRNSRLESLFVFFGIEKQQIEWNAVDGNRMGIISPSSENHVALEKSRERALLILRRILFS